MAIEYRVRQSSKKRYVVEKGNVTPSALEPGGHFTLIEIMTRPLDYDQAQQICRQFNESERARARGNEKESER